MKTPEERAVIARLHAAYCQASGASLALTIFRQERWELWLKYRRDEPFSEDDLRIVIASILRGIGNGKRNMGALKFSNLIEQPPDFEEELAMARTEQRVKQRQPKTDPARESVLRQTGRPVTQPTTGAKPIGDYIAEMRRVVG